MSSKVQQSVCSDCVTYAKSRIKFNTLNTFNNVETMDEEVYEIKKDGMTRAERRAYKRMLAKQKKG